MKNFLFIISLFSALSSMSAVKYTVADGDWHNDANWLPAGEPFMEDTVLVTHNMTIAGGLHVEFGCNWMIVNAGGSVVCDTIFALHGNLKVLGSMDVYNFAIGDGDSTQNYGTISGIYYIPANPVNINYGTILSDSLTAGENFDNYGLIDAVQFTTAGDYFINHSSAAMVVSGLTTLSNASGAFNEANATMVLGDLLTNENLTNNGDISCANWTHGAGTVDGSTGKFCITACFMNSSIINGTVDICDASPAGFCDFDFGTIAGTVTNCTSGACTSNVGLADQNSDLITANPNPFSDQVVLSYSLLQNSLVSLYIYDLNGRIIKTLVNGNQSAGEQKIIWQGKNNNDAEVAPGLYFYSATINGKQVSGKVVLN